MIDERLLAAKAEAKKLFGDFPEYIGVGIGDNRVLVYFNTEESVPQNSTLNGVIIEFIATTEIVAFDEKSS